jgi:membrane-associated PAP2 superfamily phosphatase
MSRIGLIVVLAIATVVGLVFGLDPDLDRHVTGLLFNPEFQTPETQELIRVLRDGAMWVVAALVAPAVVAVALKLIAPRRPMLMSARAALFLITTLALGPGLLTNMITKDHWGRPRPLQVQEGTEQFMPWWDPRGACKNNCSFVSGDVAGGFWTLAPASLAPPPWRPLAYAAALTFGSGIAVLRMMAGGHFFTDTVFAGVFTFLILWAVFNLLYRWQPARLSDLAIEQTLARLVYRVRNALRGGGLSLRRTPD